MQQAQAGFIWLIHDQQAAKCKTLLNTDITEGIKAIERPLNVQVAFDRRMIGVLYRMIHSAIFQTLS